MENFMNIVKKNKMWIGIGACAIAIIGCFLPIAKVSVLGFSQSVTYMDGDGVLILIAMVISGVLFFLKKDIFTLIPTGIALLITLYDIINVSKYTGGYGLGSIKIGIGAFVIIIALIVAVVLPLITKEKKSA